MLLSLDYIVSCQVKYLMLFKYIQPYIFFSPSSVWDLKVVSLIAQVHSAFFAAMVVDQIVEYSPRWSSARQFSSSNYMFSSLRRSCIQEDSFE